MPVQYEGIIAEHLWTRTSAGLFDVSHMGQLRVTGERFTAALGRAVPSFDPRTIVAARVARQRAELLAIQLHSGCNARTSPATVDIQQRLALRRQGLLGTAVFILAGQWCCEGNLRSQQ